MRIILLMFICLILTAAPLLVVQAAEGEVSSESPVLAQTEADAGKSLFEGRCQMCHQLPEPSMLRPNQWKLILAIMQQRMQQTGVPQLTEEETEIILQYIVGQSG